jgi:hypothetical protein
MAGNQKAAATIGPDKRNKAKKQQRRRAMAPAGVARVERFYLSPCSKTYLKALTDPFSLDAGMACVPDLRDYPSQKLMCKARGTFAAGSGGLGFVVVTPLINSGASPAICTSQSAFAGTSVDVTAANTTQINLTQIPYTAGQLANMVGRTVASGLRVRYVGTELARGGTLIVARLPINSTFQGKSFADLMSTNSIQTIPVTKTWATVTFVPSGDSDYEYNSNANGIVAADSGLQCRLGCLVSGSTGGNTFEWEFVVHKEYYSTNPAAQAVPNLSVSHSDTVGMSAIRNYFEGTIDYLGGPKAFQNALAYVQKYVPVETSHIGTVAGIAYSAAKASGYL